ncbi:MAG TPA: hypothetical protein VM659_15920 [Dongiaceae bacterium]|nr:hypothetical protein [Dongiaceae bacterium]
MNKTASALAFGCLLLVSASATSWAGGAPGGAHTEVTPDPNSQLTPEEKMNRRFPQKVRVGDLIGLPMLDYDDRTMGRVTGVARTADGKIQLISTCCGYFDWSRHEVAVPIETVAILARQIDVLDITREDFFKLASWKSGEATQLGVDETIRIAISRR